MKDRALTIVPALLFVLLLTLVLALAWSMMGWDRWLVAAI